MTEGTGTAAAGTGAAQAERQAGPIGAGEIRRTYQRIRPYLRRTPALTVPLAALTGTSRYDAGLDVGCLSFWFPVTVDSAHVPRYVSEIDGEVSPRRTPPLAQRAAWHPDHGSAATPRCQAAP